MTKQLVIDLVGLAGVGSAAYGIWQIHAPSAFIAVGVGLIGYALKASK